MQTVGRRTRSFSSGMQTVAKKFLWRNEDSAHMGVLQTSAVNFRPHCQNYTWGKKLFWRTADKDVFWRKESKKFSWRTVDKEFLWRTPINGTADKNFLWLYPDGGQNISVAKFEWRTRNFFGGMRRRSGRRTLFKHQLYPVSAYLIHLRAIFFRFTKHHPLPRSLFSFR